MHSNPAVPVAFTDVNVEPDPEFIKAGVSEDDQFLLPLALHPWHKGSTHSYCIRLRLDGDRHLIVPCMELVRFYFGSSSRLLRLLFRPELRREDLYDPKRSFVAPSAEHSHISLSPGLPASSAPDVARLAGDRHAWCWAARIGASLAAPHHHGHVRTSFPFAGTTSLQVRGLWLPKGDRADATFVVHQVLSCSHPLPFQRLTYRLASLDKLPDPATPPRRRQAGPTPAPNAADPVDELTLVEREPGHFQPQAFRFPRAQRFTDLEHKALFKSPHRSTASATALPASITTPAALQEAAFGDAGASDRIRPVEAETRSDPPAFLKAILEGLGTQRRLRVESLTEDGADGWTQPLAALLPTPPGHLAHIEDPATGHRHPRRVAVLALLAEDWRIDWVIIEHDWLIPILIRHQDTDCAPEAFLSELIAHAWALFQAALAQPPAHPLKFSESERLSELLRQWDGV